MNWQAEVDKFLADAPKLLTLIDGLSPAELTATPVPGKWSLQTLVAHVVDSDLIATHRMKRIIAEDNPLLIAYDEDKFAANLFYDRLDLKLTAELFRLNRLQMGQILRRLPDAAFSRKGVHNQRGLVTLGEVVKMYTHHVEHHMTFAREKLKALGKPVAV
jgi:hypothetical protein